MTYEFDEDTAVSPLGAGTYAGQISPRWNVGDKPNGGYLLAIAVRATEAEIPQPHPFTTTAHYLKAADPGGVNIDVETVRSGRSLATAEARMYQGDAEVLRVLSTFGDLARLDGPTHITGGPPDLPPVEDCLRGRAKMPDGTVVPIAERFEVAAHPDTLGWVRGRPTGQATLGAWVRFADGRPADPLSLTLIVDALPPPVFDLGAQGWVPTIELTVHVRGLPAPGWLKLWASTRFLQGGYLEEDVEVWDTEGRLVAHSRQLARLTGWARPPN